MEGKERERKKERRAAGEKKEGFVDGVICLHMPPLSLTAMHAHACNRLECRSSVD